MLATIHGYQHSYEELGSGPAILVLHDGTSDATLLDSHLNLLASCGHRVIITNPLRTAAAEPRNIAQRLLDLLNYLGIGRVLVIAVGDAATLRALLAHAPQRVVAASRVAPEPGCSASLAEALSSACRRSPLQRLNRRLGGLLEALLPPADDGEEAPLHDVR